MSPTIKVTIIGRYDTEGGEYPEGSTPQQMADLDAESLSDGSFGMADLMEWFEERDISVKFEAE